MAYRVTLVPRQINGETVAPRPYSDNESSETWGRQKNKKQKVGNVLGLSPHWGLRAWDAAGRECWVRSLGTVFPICSCTATAAPREGREGVGQECILPLGEATLPTLQLSTHRRSSEESEEKRQAITKDFSQGRDGPGYHLQPRRILLTTASRLPRRQQPWHLRGLRKG